MKKTRKYKRVIRILLLLSLNIMLSKTIYAADNTSIKASSNIRAYRQSNTSIRIKWKAVANVDGYMIYRYNQKSKQYIKIHTIRYLKSNQWVKWTDKNLETNKIYKYKIASYKKIDGKKQKSNLSNWVSAKTYQRNNKKINARAPKLNKKKVYLGLCSSKKVTAKIMPSQYGKNKKKKAFNTKVRWYSSNPSVAKVNREGVITAGKKAGKCNVYAISHNGTRTKVEVIVKNYARVKDYYNYDKGKDIYLLIAEYKEQIQRIAEYYSINRVKKGSMIRFELNDDAKVVVTPANADIGDLQKDIEALLVDFPYYISVKINESCVEYRLKLEDTKESLIGHVRFWYDMTCNKWWEIQIASHWEAYRFVPH